jgi:hypothetical protein
MRAPGGGSPSPGVLTGLLRERDTVPLTTASHPTAKQALAPFEHAPPLFPHIFAVNRPSLAHLLPSGAATPRAQTLLPKTDLSKLAPGTSVVVPTANPDWRMRVSRSSDGSLHAIDSHGNMVGAASGSGGSIVNRVLPSVPPAAGPAK